MNVVVEGIDGAGKTRLARAISAHLSLEYLDRSRLGHGPPKTHEEVIARLERYLQEDNVVFDRHTAISQPIYGMLRKDPPLPEALIAAFYAQNPIIIYARCVDARLVGHKASEHDSEEHLKALDEKYEVLLEMYDGWANRKARILYNDYSQTKMITRMVQGAIGR